MFIEVLDAVILDNRKQIVHISFQSVAKIELMSGGGKRSEYSESLVQSAEYGSSRRDPARAQPF